MVDKSLLPQILTGDPSLKTAHKKTPSGMVYTQLLLQRRSQATLAAGNVIAAVVWNAGVIFGRHHATWIHHYLMSVHCGNSVPIKAWAGPEDSRRLRLTDFKIIG